ncbi:unnamed protein product [Phytophthora fragariaefolia]|uniref:Unnamed protein product n=1 Tax=Phytophthora fragariaefolia TaxID=1490495 RepID=A0A9W6X2W0_9STRA|nr:unnamed protein product [Phytophthora fragariaefolia]
MCTKRFGDTQPPWGLKLELLGFCFDSGERHRLMEVSPDATSPAGINGILDERSRNLREIRQLHPSNRVICRTLLAISGSNDIPSCGGVSNHTLTEGGVDTKLRALNPARVKYFKVVAKEALVELQSACKQGSRWVLLNMLLEV